MDIRFRGNVAELHKRQPEINAKYERREKKERNFIPQVLKAWILRSISTDLMK